MMPEDNLTQKRENSEKKEALLDKIISRAAWLLAEGRVVKVSPYLYYVMGRHGKHLVRVEEGKLTCTCRGFQERGICSHVVAVSTLLSMKDVDTFLDEVIRERVRRELQQIYGK